MKGNQIKINNSYESDLSSSSGLSSVEENIYEYRTCNEGFPKLQEMLKPMLSHMEKGIEQHKANKEIKIIERITTSTQHYGFVDISADKENIIKKNNAITSSQESNFIGFTSSEISDSSPKMNGCTIASSQESDFAGFSDQSLEIDNSIQTSLPLQSETMFTTKCVNDDAEKLQLPSSEKDFSKVTENNTIICEMITENSCNAVDMKLSNKIVDSDITGRISFNGTLDMVFKKAPPEVDIRPKACAFNFEDNQNNEVYKYANERSPDLFDDDDENTTTTVEPATTTFIQDHMNDSIDEVMPMCDLLRKERELLRRIQNSLAGIPPPPSVTITQIDMFKSIANNKDNILKFYDGIDVKSIDQKGEDQGLFKPSHSLKEVVDMQWPNILQARHHGLCYNLSTYTEKIELLNLSVLERYVGAETSSSFRCSPSSAKKRNARIKMLTQSPGNRLSHLARRRAIFSSANLQCNSQKVTQNRIGTKQILLDNKKSENRRKQKIITPKRRTPGKRKLARNTPTSSAKKKLLFRPVHANPAPSRETSKRALFQSPQQAAKIISRPVIKPEIATRVEKSKRALFSPEKSSTSQLLESPSTLATNASKRRRLNSDAVENNSKILRLNSISAYEGLTPRSLKLKSQSFCVGSSANVPADTIMGKSLFRNSSDTFCSSQLSESHKKKLLWAVSQALQGKQIGAKHPSFKQYASVLARVVKRVFLENYNKSGSASDTLIRLAKKYVFWVIQGKTADDIYLQERAKLDQEKMYPKLIGYIAPEDYENRKAALVRKCSHSTFFSENSMDSFSLSQPFGCANINQNTQSTEFLSQISQESKTGSAMKLAIPSLQSSSSKSNLHGIALRENIDGELRRSAQKNFTGKDQSNLSPYSDKVSSSTKKYVSNVYDTNSMKVKRQISFDS